MNKPPNSQTDWERLDAMTDDEVDLSDIPEITPETVESAIVHRGGINGKQSETEYLLSNPANAAYLAQSIAEAQEGKTITITLADLFG